MHISVGEAFPSSFHAKFHFFSHLQEQHPDCSLHEKKIDRLGLYKYADV